MLKNRIEENYTYIYFRNKGFIGLEKVIKLYNKLN